MLDAVGVLFDELTRPKQRELLTYLLEGMSISRTMLEVRFWGKSPLAGPKQVGVEVGSSAWFDQCMNWLPG